MYTYIIYLLLFLNTYTQDILHFVGRRQSNTITYLSYINFQERTKINFCMVDIIFYDYFNIFTLINYKTINQLKYLW